MWTHPVYICSGFSGIRRRWESSEVCSAGITAAETWAVLCKCFPGILKFLFLWNDWWFLKGLWRVSAVFSIPGKAWGQSPPLQMYMQLIVATCNFISASSFTSKRRSFQWGGGWYGPGHPGNEHPVGRMFASRHVPNCLLWFHHLYIH